MCWKRLYKEDSGEEDKSSLKCCFLRRTVRRTRLSPYLCGYDFSKHCFERPASKSCLSKAPLGIRFIFLALSEASSVILKAHVDDEEPPHENCLSAVRWHLEELEGGCARKHTVSMAVSSFLSV